MALITLLLLLLFCAPAVRDALDHPPIWLGRVADAVTERLNPLAMWALIYALVSIFLTPFFVTGTLDVLARIFASTMLLLLAVPAGAAPVARMISNKTGEQTNAAIGESLNDIIVALARHHRLLSYAGLVAAVLLFAVMFR